MKPLAILLVEDQTLVRESLVALLNASGRCQVVAAVATTHAALAVLDSGEALDLLVCDYNLKGETAVDLLHSMARRPASGHPLPPVILLTSLFNALEIQQCRALGAKGFLFKEASLADLLAAFDCVAAGGEWFSLANADAGLQPLSATAPLSVAASAAPYLALTPAEREILRWLATGMSNKQIALTLGKSSETVKAQVSRLLHKLDCKTRTQAVVKAAQLNL